MPTVAQLVSDVELQVYQGLPSDDAELDPRQIKFWLSNNLNALVATECNSKLAKDEQIPVIYKKRLIQAIPESQEEGKQDRIVVELNVDVLVLNKDAGIIRVITDAGDIVTKMSVETINMLRYMPYASPSIENLIYYRAGKNLFIEGLKPVDLPFTELYIDYVPKQDLLSLEDTDEVLVSDLVLPQLISSVVDLAKQELYGSQKDLTNDGVDNTESLYHQQIKRNELPDA